MRRWLTQIDREAKRGETCLSAGAGTGDRLGLWWAQQLHRHGGRCSHPGWKKKGVASVRHDNGFHWLLLVLIFFRMELYHGCNFSTRSFLYHCCTVLRNIWLRNLYYILWKYTSSASDVPGFVPLEFYQGGWDCHALTFLSILQPRTLTQTTQSGLKCVEIWLLCQGIFFDVVSSDSSRTLHRSMQYIT